MSGRPTIDPVLLEVLRNRLEAIADEMELTLLKSAASPIVKEGLDASAALFSVQGETIAQAAAIPIHLGALQFAEIGRAHVELQSLRHLVCRLLLEKKKKNKKKKNNKETHTEP